MDIDKLSESLTSYSEDQEWFNKTVVAYLDELESQGINYTVLKHGIVQVILPLKAGGMLSHAILDLLSDMCTDLGAANFDLKKFDIQDKQYVTYRVMMSIEMALRRRKLGVLSKRTKN